MQPSQAELTKLLAPSEQTFRPARHVYLFDTKMRNVWRSGQQLWAVCHRYGKFTLEWRAPPDNAEAPHCRAQPDLETGLAQIRGSGLLGPAYTFHCFLQWLAGELAWSEDGNPLRGASTEYENTLEDEWIDSMIQY